MYVLCLRGSSSKLHSWSYTFPSIHELLDDIICNIAIYANNTTLCYKCDQADQWQQLELASELLSDPQDTVDWSRKWFVDFNVGKTQLVYFDRSNIISAIDVKMEGSSLQENNLFRCWGVGFLSKLGWASYIFSFLLLRLLCAFINLPYGNYGILLSCLGWCF